MLGFLQATLSGVCFWLGFAPFQWWFAPFVGTALLFNILTKNELSRRVALSFVSGATFFLLLLHWSSTYVGAIPWLILAFGQATFFLLLGLFPIQRTLTGAITFASAFTLIEIFRMKLPFGGFGWGRLGFTQVDNFSPLYSLIGVTGVTFFVGLSSLLLLKSRSKYVFISVVALSFFLPNFQSSAVSNLRIAAVQGGVDKLGFDFNDRALSVLNRHVDVSQAITDVDLIVWPENSSDVDPVKNASARKSIADFISAKRIPLLIGAVESGDKGPLNTSLLYDTNGKIDSRYVKQDLAPFGEYIPLRSWAEAISPYATNVRDFQPGNSWVKHRVKGIPFQSLICFEILDDDHVRAGADGTGFLVAQTNNATFGTSSEAAQQLQITRARAAELGRDFVVASTTGFTAHIDRLGNIQEIAPQFEPRALTMNVSAVDAGQRTPASRIPSWNWVVMLGLVLLREVWLYRR